MIRAGSRVGNPVGQRNTPLTQRIGSAERRGERCLVGQRAPWLHGVIRQHSLPTFKFAPPRHPRSGHGVAIAPLIERSGTGRREARSTRAHAVSAVSTICSVGLQIAVRRQARAPSTRSIQVAACRWSPAKHSARKSSSCRATNHMRPVWSISGRPWPSSTAWSAASSSTHRTYSALFTCATPELSRTPSTVAWAVHAPAGSPSRLGRGRAGLRSHSISRSVPGDQGSAGTAMSRCRCRDRR